ASSRRGNICLDIPSNRTYRFRDALLSAERSEAFLGEMRRRLWKLQIFDEIIHVAQHFSLFALKQVMISVCNADNPCLRNLNLKGVHLILHCASEGRRVGNVEDG